MRSTMCAVVALSAVAAARADVLYSQGNDQAGRPSLFSDGVAGQFFSQRMADNFTATSGWEMTGLRWWGGSQNFQFRDLTNMRQFAVRIYEDGGGAPDAEIYGEVFDKAATSPAATGLVLSGQGIQYEQVVTLMTPVQLEAGRGYWVSIGAILDQPAGDAWVWNHSSVGDGINASDFFTGGQYLTFPSGDMAFEVLGTVPGPGSAGMASVAVLLSGRRRRRHAGGACASPIGFARCGSAG